MPRYPSPSNASVESQRLLTSIGDAALELGGVSKPTVYALVNQGELQKVNIGRRGFITTASLTAYVERLAKTAAREQRKAAVAARIAGLDADAGDGAA